MPWVDPSPPPLALAAWGSAGCDPRANLGGARRRSPRPLPLAGVGALGRAEWVGPPSRRVWSPKPRERAVTPEGGGTCAGKHGRQSKRPAQGNKSRECMQTKLLKARSDTGTGIHRVAARRDRERYFQRSRVRQSVRGSGQARSMAAGRCRVCQSHGACVRASVGWRDRVCGHEACRRPKWPLLG